MGQYASYGQWPRFWTGTGLNTALVALFFVVNLPVDPANKKPVGANNTDGLIKGDLRNRSITVEP